MYQQHNPSSIQSLFDNIAPRYDIGNSLMSFHMHALWNRRFAKLLFATREASNALDLCAGTGEIVLRACRLRHTKQHYTLVDFSHNMLQVAEKRLATYAAHCSFVQADATCLPLPSEQYDTATLAYGIRNIAHKEACFQEAHRVLKPAGLFGILELTRPTNILLRTLHSLYLKSYVPLVGRYCISNRAAYEYLCRSIHAFPEPAAIAQLLAQARFSSIQTIPLFGGIATIFLATKHFVPEPVCVPVPAINTIYQK